MAPDFKQTDPGSTPSFVSLFAGLQLILGLVSALCRLISQTEAIAG